MQKRGAGLSTAQHRSLCHQHVSAGARTGQEGLQRLQQRGAGGADARGRGALEARRQQRAGARAGAAEQLPAQAAVVPRARQQLEAPAAAAAPARRAVRHPQRRLQRQQVRLALPGQF